MLAYAVFVLGFNYVNFDTPQYAWKLAIETWVMIIFITWILWNTGTIQSPLLNLYLLVVISSAITLDKVTTTLEIILIFAVYVFFSALKAALNMTWQGSVRLWSISRLLFWLPISLQCWPLMFTTAK